MEEWKKKAKKVWHFIWYDDSALSWVVNIILAFIIVKFIIYPGLSLILGTSLPLVAVISGSMEHNGLDFNAWWDENRQWYEDQGITKDQFKEFRLKNGFSKGDVIILTGAGAPKVGEVLVYSSNTHKYPIIHRVTYINDDENTYQLKGDNNQSPDPIDVTTDITIGKAVAVIPKIGWIKIWFTQLTGL